MKKTIYTLLFIWFVVIGFAFTTVAQEISAGKVPRTSEKLTVNYDITNDVSIAAGTAYGQAGIAGQFISMPIPAGTPFTIIAPMPAPGFLSSATFGPTGILYFTDLTTRELYTVDTGTGAITLVGSTVASLNGITYDWSTGTFWAIDATSLYTIDVATGATTLVGAFGLGGGELMIDVTVDCDGNMYAYGIVSDSFYSIDPGTGTATLIGVLGYDAQFGQGMSYDYATGILYLSAFNLTTNTGQLRTVDVTTGMTSLVFDWGFEQVAPFAIDNVCVLPPNAPTLNSPDNGALEVETSLLLTWTASAGADSYGLQISLTSDFSSNINIDGITPTSFSISNLAENTKYYWRVNASNFSGTSSYSSPFNFTTVSTITLSNTIAYPSKTNPSDYTSNEYRIVGLPGASNLNVSSILSGTQGTDWEVYWDNGAATDFYVKFNSSSPFRFSTGRSYWIIRKGNLNINQTVQAAPLSNFGTVNIQLGDGFNLITNPFTVTVDWNAVQAANGGFTEGINAYNNGWSTSQTLEPYIGYLYDNPGLNTLQIPYPNGSQPLLEKKSDPAIWRVNVELTCGELFDKTTSFGISGEATEGRDKLDFRKPRGMGKVPVVYFYHPDWDNGYGIFATDIRPEFEEEQTWDLTVYSELRESEKLTFSGIEEIPIELEIFLIDKDRAKYLNLREKSDYEFTPVKNVSEFQILVGNMEKISSKLNNLIPSEFELGNNFPNPFNPVTTIPLSVPQSAEIRLVIYDILGQEVKVLFNGTVEAGKHWYVWDGKGDQGFTVPSGIYVYNFISDAGINISRKMILMK